MVVGTLSLVSNRSNQRTAVDAVCSGIVVYGGQNIVLWCKKVKPVDAVCSMQWTQ